MRPKASLDELSLGRGTASKGPVLGMFSTQQKEEGGAHERASLVAPFWEYCLSVAATSKSICIESVHHGARLEPVSSGV